MPFLSDSQRRWMFANHPEIAKEWAKETPNIKNLPEHVTKKKKKISIIKKLTKNKLK